MYALIGRGCDWSMQSKVLLKKSMRRTDHGYRNLTISLESNVPWALEGRRLMQCVMHTHVFRKNLGWS